ncbi:MAG: homoserine dehydrogenase [Desulfurococcaceae archaeon]
MSAPRRFAVLVAGFGSVGRALARAVAMRSKYIELRHAVQLKVVGVVDSRGAAIKPEGFTDYELLKLAELPRGGVSSFQGYGRPGLNAAEALELLSPDALAELTPANYETGEPGLSHVLAALRAGCHVVTSNKAPLVKAFARIMDEARRRGLSVRYRATVMGGSPFMEALLGVRSHEVVEVRGLLNATTNYVLTLMQERRIDMGTAVRHAQAVGVAEADPSLDLAGVDAAAKLVIISWTIGRPIGLEEVRRRSVEGLKLEELLGALARGKVVKQVAYLNPTRGEAYVEPVELEASDPLASISGTTNAVKVVTDATEFFFVGKGGGGVETAHSVLDDLIAVALGGGHG